MIVKILVIALVSIFVSSTLKKYNQELASFVSICGGIIIFLTCIETLSDLISYFFELYNLIGFEQNYLKLIFKIVGVGYITEFTADIAEDFGDKIISSRVILGGKLVICGMAIPIVKSLLSMLLKFLQ